MQLKPYCRELQNHKCIINKEQGRKWMSISNEVTKERGVWEVCGIYLITTVR